MVEFRCTRRDKTNTPILYNSEIWEYAEAIVGDYKPQLLKEPGRVNGIHFIESYLGASVDYQYIYYPEGTSPIAGATVFNDDIVSVFDREHLCIRRIHVSENTIILDNMTQEEGKEDYANFTALHEGGHFCMHSGVYRRDSEHLSESQAHGEGQSVQCCRRADILGCRHYHQHGHYTSKMSLEHQANAFAAFVLMPRHTFIPFAKELARKEGFADDGIFVEYPDWESDYHIDNAVNILRDTYGASYTAVRIHLKELGLLMNYHTYEEQYSHLSTAN